MEISQFGLELLENFEGIVLHPYKDKAGVWTIGMGTTFYPNGKIVKSTDPVITKEQAYEYAKNAINKTFIPNIQKVVKVPLNQNQIDALVSFSYNQGNAAFSGSHLLIKINQKASCSEITAEFNKWVYVNHKIDNWQVKRRAKEAQVFCSQNN